MGGRYNWSVVSDPVAGANLGPQISQNCTCSSLPVRVRQVHPGKLTSSQEKLSSIPPSYSINNVATGSFADSL